MFLIRQEPLDILDDQFVYFDEKNTIQSFTGLNGHIPNLESINRYVLTVEDGGDLIFEDFELNGQYIYYIYDSSIVDSIITEIRKSFADGEYDGWNKLNPGLWVSVSHIDDDLSAGISISEKPTLIFSSQYKLTNDEILKFLNEVDLKGGIPSINYINSVNKMGFIAQITSWNHIAGVEDNDLQVYIIYTLKKLMKRYTCPCCGYKTLRELNNWETCQVCKWNDDDIQSFNPDIRGANDVSLREAQKNYKEIGRTSKTFYHSDPEPTTNYEKDVNWSPLDK